MAEWAAVLALTIKEYRMLARWFKTPAGEIGILARRGRTLVVVEVKARTLADRADFALGPRQRLRRERAAAAATARPGLGDLEVRFDVVLVEPFRWPRHLPVAWRPFG